MLNFLLAFIPRAVVQGIPLLFGSTGEIVTEKSGYLPETGRKDKITRRQCQKNIW